MPKLFGRQYTREELLRRVGRLNQVGGVELLTLNEGRERGVRVLEFVTGSGLSFRSLVDRAMDIGFASYQGSSLSWLCNPGFPGPWYFEPEPLGMLRTFGGGLIFTGGLDHIFLPAEDSAEQYGYPIRPRESYPLHGRLSSVPARLASYGNRWEGDECHLFAEGEIHQVSAYGESLLLRRRISSALGANDFQLRDEVENIGFHRTPHMLLYHINPGFPVLDEGSELLFDGEAIPIYKTADAVPPSPFHGPRSGFVEQAYQLVPRPDPGGKVTIILANRAFGEGRGLGIYVRYDCTQLPYCILWRMLGEGDYAIGIEPCTNPAKPRAEQRAAGQISFLEQGERRVYDLAVGVLPKNEDIRDMRLGRILW
jgi:hypothetical protein